MLEEMSSSQHKIGLFFFWGGGCSLDVGNRAMERWTSLKLHGPHRPWSFRVLEIQHIDQTHTAIDRRRVWISAQSRDVAQGRALMIFSHAVFFLGEIKSGDWYVINMGNEIFVSFGWDRLLCFHGSESNEECLWWKYRKQNWRMHVCGGGADCGRKRDLDEY